MIRHCRFNGYILNRISSSSWKEFEHRAQTRDAQDTDDYPLNLDEFIQGTDLRSVTSSEYTFWRFNEEGIDTDYALQRMKSVLNVFLGQLSFVSDNNTYFDIDRSTNRVQVRNRTVFRLPPFYLIFRDSLLERIHPDTYPVQKPIPRIRTNFNFVDALDPFPSLMSFGEMENSIYEDDGTVHVRSVEATLATAFRTLGQAMRKTDPETMFLWLYRTLEHITFTRNAESKEPPMRALRLLCDDIDQQTKKFIDVVKNKRNMIVHDGTDLQITETELNLLKSLSISTIKRVGELSQIKTTDEIISRLKINDIEDRIQDLKDEESELQNELQILESVQNWED